MKATPSPEQARELLQTYIDAQAQRHGRFFLPITDVIVTRSQDKHGFAQYSWRYLLSLAYYMPEENKSDLFDQMGRRAAEDPSNLTEYADILLCLFSSVHKAGFSYADLMGAAETKFANIKDLRWEKRDDGTVEYVKGTPRGKCPRCASNDYAPVAPSHTDDKCNQCGWIWEDR